MLGQDSAGRLTASEPRWARDISRPGTKATPLVHSLGPEVSGQNPHFTLGTPEITNHITHFSGRLSLPPPWGLILGGKARVLGDLVQGDTRPLFLTGGGRLWLGNWAQLGPQVEGKRVFWEGLFAGPTFWGSQPGSAQGLLLL